MELQKTTGIVLSSTPIGENDRRLVLLTKENGKLSAFARGARRPNSALLAASMPFSFGVFYYYSGRTSNTITQAEIKNFFPKLHEDLTAAYYGLYFMEITEYYTREYNDEMDMLKLIYQSLRALSNAHLKKRLVRCIFEWKTLVVNGEYPDVTSMALSDTVRYTLQFITATPIEKVYTFTVSEPVLEELENCVRKELFKQLDRPMKSLEMLNTVVADEKE